MDSQASDESGSPKPQTPPRTTHRGWVTIALLLAMFMAAIESTIVATAMPRIVADLGGFSLYSWVFSMYLLTQVVTIPVYGKLADLYGRKPVFVVGATIFLIGSFLCGHATTMLQLIAYRTLQGIGSGAVQPIAITVVGDLYKGEERHRAQGWTSSVWAISAIVGPALGGFIVDFLQWPWVFYLNLPIGVFAIAGVVFFLHENVAHRRHSIDIFGVLLLIVAVGGLMLAMLQGGTAWAWTSWQSIALFAFSLCVGLGFVFWERVAKEPIIPVAMLKERLVAVAGGASLFNGALTLGYSAMVPTFVQGVLHGTAIQAGFALASMSIGWPLASFMSGRVMNAIGYRKMAILGAVLTMVGSIAIALFASFGIALITGCVFLIGMGLGFLSNAFIITIQSSVPWSQRGVATANVLFMRTLGSTVGVALLGSILNAELAYQLVRTGASSTLGASRSVDLINRLLDPAAQARLGALRSVLVGALGTSMHAVFWGAFALAVLGTVWVWFLPTHVDSQEAAQSA